MKYINEHIDVFKVTAFNLLSIIFSFTNVENTLKILVLIATLSYTLWKWFYDYKKNNKNGHKRTGKASN